VIKFSSGDSGTGEAQRAYTGNTGTSPK
jgi:hypothetical protein